MSLLSKSTVQKILSEDKSKRAEWGKPSMPAGEHLLTLSGVELKNSKQTNDAMLVITLSEGDKYNPLTEIYMLSGKGAEVGLQRIVTFMANAFKHEMDDCEDEKSLLVAIMKFKGKKFKAAVKIHEELYVFTDNTGKDQATIQKKSKLWYCSTADDTTFQVNILKANIPLSAEDKKKYLDFKESHPDTGAQTTEEKPKEESPW